MKNKKLIVINGFQRGGTNIVYNIFQSHPQVCSANDLETGQILSQNYRIPSRKILGYFIKRLKLSLYDLLNKKFILNSFMVSIFGIVVDYIFYKYKLKNFYNKYNRFKYENILYSMNEIKGSVLCLKSVNNDIRLTRFLSKIYDDIYFIGLVRNGYALCESWIRRGKDAKICGFRYRKFCKMMISDSKEIKNYKIVKFEDVIKNPFNMATNLYAFTHLKPVNLDKLRFKSKKVLTGNGNHKVKFGRLDEKYWFDRESLKNLIDPKINEIQTQKLSESDKKVFTIYIKSLLKYFNYKD